MTLQNWGWWTRVSEDPPKALGGGGGGSNTPCTIKLPLLETFALRVFSVMDTNGFFCVGLTK